MLLGRVLLISLLVLESKFMLGGILFTGLCV